MATLIESLGIENDHHAFRVYLEHTRRASFDDYRKLQEYFKDDKKPKNILSIELLEQGQVILV